MKKHKAPQVPLPLFGQAEEPFALVQETTQDGQRLAAEQAQREADRTHTGTLQRSIPGIKGTFHVY